MIKDNNALLNVSDTELNKLISSLVDIVYNIHFKYVNDRELIADLKQEGFLKAYSLIKMNIYNPTKNLRTFLYSGIRNAMSNYMYHYDKKVKVNLPLEEAVDFGIDINSIYVDYNIDFKKLLEIQKKYSEIGDVMPIMINHLHSLGLINFKINDKFDKKILAKNNKNIIERVVIGEMIWKILGN